VTHCCVDFLGSGRSSCPRTEYNLDFYVLQTEQLLEALGFDSVPFILIGSSMGGLISAKYSTLHPELVKRLILINPAGLPIQAKEHLKYVFSVRTLR